MAFRLQAAFQPLSATPAGRMSVLELLTHPLDVEQPICLVGSELGGIERDPGFALGVKTQQMFGPAEIAGREHASRNGGFHARPLAVARIGRAAIEKRAREVFLKENFEGHAHAFPVTDNIDQSCS